MDVLDETAVCTRALRQDCRVAGGDVDEHSFRWEAEVLDSRTER